MYRTVSIWILSIPFLLFASSIVMIVYGAIFLRQPNMEREFAFNRAAAAYFEGDSPQRMAHSNATFDDTRPMSLSLSQYLGHGPDPPPPIYTTIFQSTGQRNLSHTMQIRYEDGPYLSLNIPATPDQDVRRIQVACPGDDDSAGCSRPEMLQYCIEEIGCNAILGGGPPDVGGGQQSNCYYAMTIPIICRVVQKDPGGTGNWVPHPDMQYCEWPFNLPGRICGFDQDVIPFQIRTADDPYVVMSKITQGTNWFDRKRGTIYVYGQVLAGSGSLLLIGSVALSIYLRLTYVYTMTFCCDCSRRAGGGSAPTTLHSLRPRSINRNTQPTVPSLQAPLLDAQEMNSDEGVPLSLVSSPLNPLQPSFQSDPSEVELHNRFVRLTAGV